MRRLKVNKKSLLQKGGTPAPKVSMDTDTILQDIREKVQGGVSEVEIFQNLMEQQIPLDEIQTAFTALGYDETMLSNIMQAIQQSASVQEEPIGEVQGSELPKASTGFFGGNPAFSGTLGTYHQSPDGFMPAKGFYLPQDLGNRGNIFGALSTAAEAFNTLFSGKDLNNDGVADGSLRNLGVKRRRHRDNRGSYYTYDVEYDPNDTNTYNLNAKDLFKGKLRTNEQYTQDLLDNSMINYNVNTGQYETLLSADPIKKNRFTLNDPNRDILKGRSFSDFYNTLKDNPAHLEMLAQQIGLIKDDYLPAGVSYGVDKDGAAASYFGANPYLYETMMGINVATGDKSREYTKDDLNTNPYRISVGGLQNNVGLSFNNTRSTNPPSNNPPSNNPPSNNPPSSNVDYSYLDPTLNTMFDFEKTSGGFDDVTGKAYGLSNLGANRYTNLDPSDPDYLDPKDPNFRANLMERVKRDYAPSLQGFDKSLQPSMLDFAYNTGRDPRIYLLDQYMKSQGNTAGLDDRGAYKDAMKNFSWTDPNMQSRFDQVYGDNAAAISALPVADQIKLMNQARQFYYNNIDMVNNQPNPAAAATWLKRPFYQQGGSLLPTFKSGGGGAGRGPAVASNRHTSQNSVSTGIDNSIGNPGDRTDYNQQQGDLDFSMFQAQEGGGFFDNFDFKGYFKGEQGLIPDYKGESTTTTVDNAVDKYGDKVSTGLDIMQTGMTAAGMVPVVGNVVDVVNAGVSGARSAYAGFTGDTDGAVKHAENAAINAASAIPGAGIAVGAAGLVKDTAGYTGLMNDKSIASNVGIQTERPLVDTPIETTPKKTVASMGYELPKYQSKGEITSALTDVAKNIVSPLFASQDLVNKISEIDLGELEDQVNENLGYTMNREVTADRDPNVRKAVELRSKFYSDPKYQDLQEQLSNEYVEGEEDEFGNATWDLTDKGKKINEQLNKMRTSFFDEHKDLFSADEAASLFYSENNDPIRHGTTGGLTAKAISDKIKNTPYLGGLLDFIGADDLGGVVGSNVLGLGHELAAYMDYGKDQDRSLLTQIKESGKDMYNNFLGSLTSVGAEDEEEIIDRVVEGVREGKYTSGRVNYDESYDKKQQGGATTLYEYYQDAGVELPSVAERRPAYQEAFGENAPYTGTAAQNTQFLEYLQSTDNPAPSSNTNMPNTETPVEEVSAPEDDPNFIGPLNLDPNANQTNSGFPDADGDGIPDTIDIDAGTGTGESVVGDDITQTEPYVPPTTDGDGKDPKIKKPKVKRRNKLAGTVNRIMDSPGMQAFGDVSGAVVAGANVVNAFFDERDYNKAKEDLVFMGMADKAYGMYEERDGDRGNFDENTGLMQPDNMRGYMARMGKETFMPPPKMQEENIVDLDYETVAKLISAGADIEIL